MRGLGINKRRLLLICLKFRRSLLAIAPYKRRLSHLVLRRKSANNGQVDSRDRSVLGRSNFGLQIAPQQPQGFSQPALQISGECTHFEKNLFEYYSTQIKVAGALFLEAAVNLINARRDSQRCLLISSESTSPFAQLWPIQISLSCIQTTL